MRRTRTGTLYLTDSTVTKVGDAWDLTTARQVCAAHEAWAERLQQVPLAETPHAVVDPSRNAVVMERVYGCDLAAMMQTGSPVEGYARTCGRALGAYHVAGDRGEAATDAERIRRRLKLPSDVTSALDPVVSAGDFAPHNVMIAERECVFVIDAEAEAPSRTRHRDLAYFVNCCAILGAPEVVPSFLEGYAEQSARAVTDEDNRLIEMYRCWFALSRTRRMVHPHHSPLKAGRYAGWAIASWQRSRRRLGRRIR